MVVMVENEEVTGTLNARRSMVDAPGGPLGAASARFTDSKLYTEYMRREGKDVSMSHGSIGSGSREMTFPSRQSSGRRMRTEPQPFQDF